MKTLFLVILSSLFYGGLSAQAQLPVEPAYKRIPTIPPFKLAMASDSAIFTKENLRKKKPVIIIVFSPDCDHCIHATEDLIKNIKSFKNTEIILASSLSYESIRKFYKDLNLAAYPNIHVGYDSKRFLNSFFDVRSFPSIFLYDKKGDFKMDFTDHPNFKIMASSL
jgi:thioredoxin-related protein